MKNTDWERKSVECGNKNAGCDLYMKITIPAGKQIKNMVLCVVCTTAPTENHARLIKTLAEENKNLKEKIRNMEADAIDRQTNVVKKNDTEWTEIVKKSKIEKPTPETNLAQLTRDVMLEKKLQEERKRNLIISGSEPQENEQNFVRQVAAAIDVDMTGVKLEAKRIGKIRDGGSQLLCITLTQEKRSELLQKCRELRNQTNFANIYIGSDLTKEGRKVQYELRQELKAKRSAEPSSEWIIKRGKVVKRDERSEDN